MTVTLRNVTADSGVANLITAYLFGAVALEDCAYTGRVSQYMNNPAVEVTNGLRWTMRRARRGRGRKGGEGKQQGGEGEVHLALMCGWIGEGSVREVPIPPVIPHQVSPSFPALPKMIPPPFPRPDGLPVRSERALPHPQRSISPKFGRALAPVGVACPENSSGCLLKHTPNPKLGSCLYPQECVLACLYCAVA